MRAAVVQMVSTDNVTDNFQIADELIRQTALEGAQLIVLPENFALFSSSKLLEASQQEDASAGPIRSFLATTAREHGVWLVGGSLPLPAAAQKVYAASFVFDPNGIERACYRKVHLFDAEVGDAQGRYRESDTLAAGDEVVSLETPFGKLGLSICYDLRFPELYRALFQQGVDLVTVPSAFTERTGRAHWQPLLQARAIENCCYVLAPNQGGQHTSKRATWGHSMIVDPWGKVLAECEEGVGFAIAEIDLAYLRELRQRMPVHAHQRIKVPEGDAALTIPIEAAEG
ncbi:MAG: carbon-nitrogen hydrolase family protein [Pseudomonadales bacterium]